MEVTTSFPLLTAPQTCPGPASGSPQGLFPGPECCSLHSRVVGLGVKVQASGHLLSVPAPALALPVKAKPGARQAPSGTAAGPRILCESLPTGRSGPGIEACAPAHGAGCSRGLAPGPGVRVFEAPQGLGAGWAPHLRPGPLSPPPQTHTLDFPQTQLQPIPAIDCLPGQRPLSASEVQQIHEWMNSGEEEEVGGRGPARVPL